MKTAVAVAETTVIRSLTADTPTSTSVRAVVFVTPTVIAQLVVFSDAVTDTSVTLRTLPPVVKRSVTKLRVAVPEQYVLCCVCVTKIAVAVDSTGTTSHHDVPSRPTRQFSGVEWLCVIGHDRFVTACVAVGV
jgi:hypothetical protein